MKFERFGGASGVVGVTAIAIQLILVGTATRSTREGGRDAEWSMAWS
jgi:hypothetical protein